MAFGSNPVTTGQGSLVTNQLPISTVAVPNAASGNLTALQGGPAASADANGNVLAPVAIYVYDGNDVTQGTSTDAANANSIIGQLKQIKTNTGSVTIGTALPAGTNVIGHVIVDSAGSVSITSLPTLPSGTNVIGHVIVDSAASVSVTTLPGVGTDGSAIPSVSMLMGASDGTLLQQLLVESSTNHNLRIGIYSGANEATVTGANALKVDNSAVTQPVSGVFWQSTQPISAASLPLPTGASTSAKQPALGTAGTASTDVLSVQGIASMTPLKTDGSGATQPVSGTVTANAGTNLNTSLLALESGGNLATTATKLTSILSQLQGILQIEQADLTTTGTISAAQPAIGTPVSNATVQLALAQGQSTWKAQLLAGGGGFTSGTTVVVDKSLDGGTTWFVANFKVSGSLTNTTVQSIVGPGPLELTGNASGVTHVRIRCSVLNSTETIAVTLRGGAGVGDVGLMSSIPAGTNNIGTVTGQAQGSPDAGATFKYLKTTSDGTQVANATLQAGTALAGGAMSYREMVARALVGSVKYLTGSVALANAQTAAISFVDQNNVAYSTVTTGKTLYIASIDATCNTTSTDVLQTTLLTLTDGTNLKYQYLVSQQTPPREMALPITLASTTTLTVKGGTSSAGANFAGSLYVSIVGWEE